MSVQEGSLVILKFLFFLSASSKGVVYCDLEYW